MTNLPEIKAIDLEKAKNDAIAKKDAWYFLFVFTDRYLEMMTNDPETMQKLNDSQRTLLSYNYLYGEVVNGGFMQLIENRYGAYIFENNFSEAIRSWGAVKIAEIVEKGKIIYGKYKPEFEKSVSNEEWIELYNKIIEFEPLNDEFYKVMGNETKIIKEYVEKNINDFGIII
jgi:hypothetical protein